MVIATTRSQPATDERQELLSALGRKVKEFIILHEVAQIAIESVELDRVLADALDKVLESVRPEIAAIILTTGHNGGITGATRGSPAPDFLNRLSRALRGGGNSTGTVLSVVPVVMEDILKHPKLASRELRDTGLRSIAAFPLKSGGDIIGTLVVASHQLYSFSPADIQLLNIISEGLGPSLKSAQLHEALRLKTHLW